MTDDRRPAGDTRNDEASHTAVPVSRNDENAGGEPESLRDDTADPAFRSDTSGENGDEQPEFLRNEDPVTGAPAVPVSADRLDDDAPRDGAFPGGTPDGGREDEGPLPVATPANWPLPTAEPAWPTDDDVVTASDLAAAEVPRTSAQAGDHAEDSAGARDENRAEAAPVAATTERDSLDDLADAEGPYVPGSYSTDTDSGTGTGTGTDSGTGTDTDSGTDSGTGTDRGDRGGDTARYDLPTAGGSSAPIAAAVVGGVVGAGAAGAGETAAPAAATPSQPVYLQAPVPPKKKGNRGVGIVVALVSALVFAALYAVGVGLLLSVTTPDAFGTPLLSYLVTPMFWLPVIVFFVAFALLVLMIHRANWWGFVLGGIPVAILVYGSYLLARVIQQNIFDITPNEAMDVVERSSTFPDGILAGLLARELVIWAGTIISARGRRVKARNAEDRAEYERKLAETPGFGPRS